MLFDEEGDISADLMGEWSPPGEFSLTYFCSTEDAARPGLDQGDFAFEI